MTITEQHPPIEQVVAAIQQRWGKRALMRLARVASDAAGIPTGYAALDDMLGGGVPRGAVTCLTGRPTSGKTALALDMLACVQRSSEVTVYIDTTGALDPEHAEGRGIDLARLLIVWPQPATLGLDITRDIVAQDGAGLIVLDAGGCTGPAAGLHRMLRQLAVVVRRSPYAVMCLAATASNSLTTALLARADAHLHAERQRWLFAPHGVVGYDTRLTVVKSRGGHTGQSVTLPVMLHLRRSGP